VLEFDASQSLDAPAATDYAATQYGGLSRARKDMFGVRSYRGLRMARGGP